MQRTVDSRLEASLRCAVRGRKKSWQILPIRTVDISRDGLLLRWPCLKETDAPARGDKLTVDILLPLYVSFLQRSIRCSGEVASLTEEGPGSLLVEMRTRRIQLQTCSESPLTVTGQIRPSKAIASDVEERIQKAALKVLLGSGEGV